MEKAEEMRNLVEGIRGSGLSVSEYCARIGVSEHRYYYWRHKLNKQSKIASKSGQFIEVGGDSTAKVEVELSNGTVIRTPLKHLGAVLREVECAR